MISITIKIKTPQAITLTSTLTLLTCGALNYDRKEKHTKLSVGY